MFYLKTVAQKIILLIIVTSLQSTLCAQNETKNYILPENRKGQVFFKVSSEYRITPLPYEAEIIVPIQVDDQNSGVAFAYTFDFFVSKNLSLGFSNSFRYDYLGGDFDDVQSDFGADPANRGLIIGFHFYLDYHFKIFKESELYVRLGRSLLNRGTQLNEKITFFDDQGNLLFSRSGPVDPGYEPWNFGLGWKKRKIEILLGFYTSSNTEYFLVPEDFIVPYFKFSYNLGRL